MNRAASRTYVQTARAESAAATGERILESMLELFRETGVPPTLEAVAERAGVTVQTVLRRFGSKSGLHDAVRARVGGRIAAERESAPIGDVEGAIENLLEHYERWGDMALRMLAAEAAAPRDGSDAPERSAASEGRGYHRGWVERTFAPQLEGLTGVAREQRVDQLAAVTDVYVWKILVQDLGRSRRRAKAALTDLVRRLTTE